MLALIAVAAIALGAVYTQTPAVDLSARAPAPPPVERQVASEPGAEREARPSGAETKLIARLPALGRRATPRSLAGEGKLVTVPGESRRAGKGPRKRFAVQVERGLRVDSAAFGREVERILFDRRSWAKQDGFSLRRTDEPAGAAFIVILGSPTATDRLCAPLKTKGIFSCASGRRAVINAARWRAGALAFGKELMDYRRYLINHEVGHTLGRWHRGCPAPKARAPVMMQQTKGVGKCKANPWPRTDEA